MLKNLLEIDIVHDSCFALSTIKEKEAVAVSSDRPHQSMLFTVAVAALTNHHVFLHVPCNASDAISSLTFTHAVFFAGLVWFLSPEFVKICCNERLFWNFEPVSFQFLRSERLYFAPHFCQGILWVQRWWVKHFIESSSDFTHIRHEWLHVLWHPLFVHQLANKL